MDFEYLWIWSSTLCLGHQSAMSLGPHLKGQILGKGSISGVDLLMDSEKGQAQNWHNSSPRNIFGN